MLKKITWTWKKIVSLILGFLGIGTLVSCYGMPITENPLGGKNYLLQGRVYGDIDDDGEMEEIPNIQVSSNYGTTKTNESGNFKILGYTEPENFIYDKDPHAEDDDIIIKREFIKLEINDTDGEQNGKFKSTTLNYFVDSYDSFHNDIDIELEKDE